MVMMKIPVGAVYISILISLAGVVVHIGALFAGLSWLVFFRVPRSVIESFNTGTVLAPVGGLIIASLMGMCGFYAASAIALVPRPPLQRTGLAVMAIICIVRALLLPVLAIGHAELYDTFEITSAIVWGLAGVGFVFAFKQAKLRLNNFVKPVPLCDAIER
jgi:hypothetical protein